MEGRESLGEEVGDGAPDSSRGGGPLAGAEDFGGGDEDVAEDGDDDEDADDDAGGLGPELAAGVGAEEVAALEVREEVAGAHGRARGDGGGHEVGDRGAGHEQAVGELGDLAQRAHGGDVRFPGDASGDDGEDDGQQDGEEAEEHRDVEEPPLQEDRARRCDRQSDREVSRRELDRLHRVGGRARRAEEATEARQGGQHDAPAEREAQQARHDHHRDAGPHRPRDDPAVAERLDHALAVELGDDPPVADERAHEDRPADPPAHQRAGGGQQRGELEHPGVARRGAEDRDGLRHRGGGEGLGEHRELQVEQVEDGGNDAGDQLDPEADGEGDEQGPGPSSALLLFGVEAAQGLGGGGTGRKSELFDVDELSLERNGDEQAQHRDREHPGAQAPQRKVVAHDEQIGRDRRHERRPRRVARGGGGRRHRVGLEDRRLRPHQPHAPQDGPARPTHDARGDDDAEAPPDLEADIQVRQPGDHPDHRPHRERPTRQLRNPITLVDTVEPRALDLPRAGRVERRQRGRALVGGHVRRGPLRGGMKPA